MEDMHKYLFHFPWLVLVFLVSLFDFSDLLSLRKKAATRSLKEEFIKKVQALFYTLLKWGVCSKHLKDSLQICTYIFKHGAADSW